MYKIPIPIYKCDLFVYMGRDITKFKKEALRVIDKEYTGFTDFIINDSEYLGSALGITFYKGKTICIHINYDDINLDCLNTLAHEIYHAVHKILNYSGLDVHETSEEAFSYLTGYVTEEVFKCLKVKMSL